MSSLIAETRKTPWKAVNEINRYLLLPRLRLMFALAGVDWGQGWRLYGAPRIQRHRESVMHFGDHMELRSSRPAIRWVLTTEWACVPGCQGPS